MKHLYYNSNHNLTLEKTDIKAITSKFRTPFYIYSTAEIRKNCNEILSHTRDIDFLPCYALKANFNPVLLKLIADMGFGADVVSGGELYFARKTGIPPEKIVFAGVGKTDEEINDAIKQGIHSLIIESESELQKVAAIAQKIGKNIVVAVRVNPDIDAKTHPYISTGLHTNKFGVSRDIAIDIFQKAAQFKYIEASGIHFHIGSQIVIAGPFLETVDFIIELMNDLEKIGINIKHLDLGGGIGINYENQYNSNGIPRTYINEILPKLIKPLKNLNKKILIELGRSIIGTAGLLITKVLYIKDTSQKKFVIVDAGMNNLIRPSLYDAYHQILSVTRKNGDKIRCDVVGPVCETSDFFARDRELPQVEEGDYLAVSGAGAYGQALSSNYNLRPTIAEYLVNENQVKIIAEGESIQKIAEKYNF
jgi:diaminopimelate decarboxylase